MNLPNLAITKITGKPSSMNGVWYVTCVYKPHGIERGHVQMFSSKEKALKLAIGDLIQDLMM